MALPPEAKPLPASSVSLAPTDYVAIANEYAEKVVAGDIIACKWVKLACKRQLDDLERKNWKYRFDPEKANRVCRFIERLPHVKGKWAKDSGRIKLEPFQCFSLTTIFGWVHKDTGDRRFREVYEEVPRKNAKSTKVAGVGLYMAAADGEEGAEVYCGATTEQQAWEVFRPIKNMVEKLPSLRTALGLSVYAGSVQQAKTLSRIEPLIGKPGDGSSPYAALVDEYHEHPDDTLYDTMKTGMGARSQPLLYAITTAGVNLGGPCYQQNKFAKEVLEGTKEADDFFCIIYTIDEGDDWKSEAALWKANPNMGVSIDVDYLRSQQRIAIMNPSKSGIFKTKHLNIWVAARSPFFNIEKWNECEARLNLHDLVGCEVIGFLDLASKKDLAAMVLIAKIEEGRYRIVPRFWLPEKRLYDTKAGAVYQGWVEQNWLTTTPGDILDFAFIEEEMRQLRELGIELKEMAYDPFQATYLSTRMRAEGFNMVEYGATVKNFSEPMKQLDALILNGNVEHDGNPVMTWCMSNVVAVLDRKENVFPTKDLPDSPAKIDGAVAAIGAMGRWVGQEIEEEISYFAS